MSTEIDESQGADEALRLVFIDAPRAEHLATQLLESVGNTKRSRAVAHLALSRIALQRGSLSQAKVHVEQAANLVHADSDAAMDVSVDASVRLAQSTLAMAEGDLVTARILASDVLELAGLSPTDRGRALFQRALVLHRQGDTPAALDDFQAAERFLVDAEPIHLVRMLLNRSAALSYLHRFAEAEHDVVRAERLAAEHGLVRQRALCIQNLGFVAAQRGDLITALQHYDEALRQLDACGADTSVVAADRGAALSAAGLFREAKRELFRALDSLASTGFASDEAETRLLIAQLASATDHHDEARDQAVLARNLFRSQDRETWAMVAEAEFLRSLFRSSPLDEQRASAEQRAGEAVLLIERLDAAGWSALAWAMRSAASVWLDQAGRSAEVPGLFANRPTATGSAQPLLTDLARGEALIHYARIERSIDRSRSAYWSAIAAFDEHRTASGSAELRARAASLAGGLVSAAMVGEAQFGTTDEALHTLDAYRDSTLRLWPLVEADDSRPTTADESIVAESRLRPRDVLPVVARQRATLPDIDAALNGAMALSFSVNHGRIDLYVRRLSETHRFPVATLAEVNDSVDRMMSLFTLACGADGRSLRLRRRFASEAAELRELLFGPVLSEWPGEQAAAVIIPDPALNGVLWGAIHPDDWSVASIAPSLSAWWRATTASSVAQGDRWFVAGPGLDGAVQETRELAAAFGGRVLGPEEADVRTVCELLATAPFVHIAAHGLFRDDHPLLSGLRLSDRVIHGYDVDRVARTPPTVVLSACEGVNVDGSPGTHLGLAAVFLARGTRSVVGALAPVPDAITVEVMKELYRDPADGLLVSLRRARRDPRPEVAHAAQAFVVMGTGGFF